VAKAEYTRLTRGHVRSGFAVAVTSRCSLWLAHDHLLFIDSNGYTETYKRFYFRDIQALTLAFTQRRLLWNCIWGALAVVCLLVWTAVVLPSPAIGTAGWISGAGLALLFSVLLLANNLLGPTCICQIKTAVQTEELAPLNRVGRARRVIARLRPLIRDAQRQLPPQPTLQEPAPGQEISSGTAAISPAGDAAEPPPPSPTPPPDSTWTST
jgi:hypothetical protein